ncbi:kinase-like domain-containing protein [Cytidiella melzeri]|nr:kinase-like domain-containing protein [Cytidiella melzeri]
MPHLDSSLYECVRCGTVFFSSALGHLHLRMQHALSQENMYSVAVRERRANLLPRLTVYQTVVDRLARKLYSLHSQEKGSGWFKEGYKLLLALNRDAGDYEERAQLLAVGYHKRSEMQDLSMWLGLTMDVGLTKAFAADDRAVMLALKDLLLQRKGKKAVLALKHSHYHTTWILNLIDKFQQELTYRDIMCGSAITGTQTDEQRVSIAKFEHVLQQIDVRLTTAPDLIPSHLMVKNVKIFDECSARRGYYVDMYKAELADGTVVALKKLRSSIFNDLMENRRHPSKKLVQEATDWKGLQHANVLSFLGLNIDCFPGSMPCMVSLWAQHESIDIYLRKCGFLLDDAHRLLYETANGLKYLHSQDVVHGDLRAANILIDDERHVRLSDFGLAKFANAGESCGSAGRLAASNWPPPESLRYKNGEPGTRHTKASDIFAFSAVCWEIWAGESPYAKLPLAERVKRISDGERPLLSESQREVSSEVWAVIQACWKHLPEHRPSARQVRKSLKPLARQGVRSKSPNKKTLAHHDCRRVAQASHHPTTLDKERTKPAGSLSANAGLGTVAAVSCKVPRRSARKLPDSSVKHPSSHTEEQDLKERARKLHVRFPKGASDPDEKEQADLQQKSIGAPPQARNTPHQPHDINRNHWNEIRTGERTINPFEPCDSYPLGVAPGSLVQFSSNYWQQGPPAIIPLQPCGPFDITARGLQYSTPNLLIPYFLPAEQACNGSCYYTGTTSWCPFHSFVGGPVAFSPIIHVSPEVPYYEWKSRHS